MYSLICFCVSGFSHDLFGVVKGERNSKRKRKGVGVGVGGWGGGGDAVP